MGDNHVVICHVGMWLHTGPPNPMTPNNKLREVIVDIIYKRTDMELLTANQLADAIIERCRWEEDKLTEIIEKRLNFIFPTLSGMCEIAAKDIARSLLSAMTEEKK